MQLLFSVMPGEAVQLRGHLSGIYAALPAPLPLKPEWLAMLLPAAAAETALSLHPRGECLNRYLSHLRCMNAIVRTMHCVQSAAGNALLRGLYVINCICSAS